MFERRSITRTAESGGEPVGLVDRATLSNQVSSPRQPASDTDELNHDAAMREAIRLLEQTATDVLISYLPVLARHAEPDTNSLRLRLIGVPD